MLTNHLLKLAAVLSLSALLLHCGGTSTSDAGVDAGAGGGDAGLGGGAGGGTGGGGGSDAGMNCAAVTFPPSSYRAAGHFPPQGTNPDYTWADFLVQRNLAGEQNRFAIELWFFGASANPTYPYAVTLGPTRFATCEVCLTYQEGCDATGVNCDTMFLAQEGTVTFTRADRDPAMGQFQSSGGGVRMVEWNLTIDRAQEGGRCIDLATFSLDGSWPAPAPDGGADGGGDDAGSDGG